MRTIQIIELEKIEDLVNISKYYIFKQTFGDVYIYYSGATSDNFIGLNVFITDKDYTGFLRIADDGKIQVKKKYDPNAIAVIPVINDTLIRNYLANYIVATRGISSDTLKAAAKKLSKILEGLPHED